MLIIKNHCSKTALIAIVPFYYYYFMLTSEVHTVTFNQTRLNILLTIKLFLNYCSENIMKDIVAALLNVKIQWLKIQDQNARI